MNNLSSNLRTRRKRRGWTQSDLAREAGVSLWTICAIERGRAKPLMATISRLAVALNVKEATLIA